MEAVVLCGPRLVKVLRVPMPVLTESDDVIVQVKYAGLCGSDLHPYRGDEKGCDYGITIMGHECVPRSDFSCFYIVFTRNVHVQVCWPCRQKGNKRNWP